jgi:hypothetical protein
MLNNRGQLRRPTARSARILLNGDGSAITCPVLNFSEGGLCLLVPSADALPDHFELVLSSSGTRHACFVAWKTQNKIGVRFT